MQDLFAPEYTYLLINAGTLLFPFLLSFDKRVAFFRQWKYLLPAIVITALVFIIWDHWFTVAGVWGFNEKYITGYRLLSLPVEEVLFFFTIPYACVFIYEVLGAYYGWDILRERARLVFTLLSLVLVAVALFHTGRLYTFITFMSAALLLTVNLFLLRSRYMGNFLLAYIIQLLPFLLVNGWLTSLPVVWYNNEENLGIRLTTIPIEDTIYSLLLLLLNITLFEAFRKGMKRNASGS